MFLDNCYTCDPRLKKFREEEKERKIAEKKAKEEATRLAAEEQEKVIVLNESRAFCRSSA